MSENRRFAPLESQHWRAVDTAAAPGVFVDYLHEAARLLRDRHQEMLRPLEVTPGCSVLDVGCGTGDMLIDLATTVDGVTGVGIDASETMVATATASAHAAGLPVTFTVGDAQRLDLKDGSFDRVVCSRVLLHIEDPTAAIREMARVLRPGGRVAILEPDFDTLMIDSDDLAVARAVRTALTAGLRNPDMGRRLRRLLLEAGFADVDVVPRVGVLPSLAVVTQQFGFFEHLETAVAAGAVAPDAADAWRAWVEAADASQRFWFALVAFSALARKPET